MPTDTYERAHTLVAVSNDNGFLSKSILTIIQMKRRILYHLVATNLGMALLYWPLINETMQSLNEKLLSLCGLKKVIGI